MIVTPEFPEHRLQDPRRQAEWRVYQEIAGSQAPASPSNLSELPNSSIIETEIVVPRPFLSSAFRMGPGPDGTRNRNWPSSMLLAYFYGPVEKVGCSLRR